MPKLPEPTACPAQTHTRPEMVTKIKAIDGTTWDYSDLGADDWCCALIADHTGTHLAHVQTTVDDQEWWLRWDDGATELVTEPICDDDIDEDQDDDEDRTYCLLPNRHDGPHTDGEMHWIGVHPAQQQAT